MMHPDTELKFVDPQIGFGVFATAPIPMGTIVFVNDALDIKVERDSPLLQDPRYRDIIKKYATIEPADGAYLISWDIAKYVNHCCHCNTISTGYGFEIAVRDIARGEQITDDYGLFNMEERLVLICRYPDCRGQVVASDFDRCSEQWDAAVKQALAKMPTAPQPLLKYLDAETYADVMHYLATGEGYRSVRALKQEHLELAS
jgi:hypothetical protein